MTVLKRSSILGVALLLLSGVLVAVHAQSGTLAATLEVLSEGVEVKRVDTANWLPVKVEAIVGVGDVIRTTATGRARITFFVDGTDTELLPDTEYSIIEFSGDDDTFTLSVEVLVGETTQRLGRILDATSRYDIKTPYMTLTARGTVFAVRVVEDEYAQMLVSEGMVQA
ncbi:MAG: FecR domain-containing protein, partial [Armatimonadetes bacterium]|nr:FecR domain-containing protein [Anaerolineae bacterium]